MAQSTGKASASHKASGRAIEFTYTKFDTAAEAVSAGHWESEAALLDAAYAQRKIARSPHWRDTLLGEQDVTDPAVFTADFDSFTMGSAADEGARSQAAKDRALMARFTQQQLKLGSPKKAFNSLPEAEKERMRALGYKE